MIDLTAINAMFNINLHLQSVRMMVERERGEVLREVVDLSHILFHMQSKYVNTN